MYDALNFTIYICIYEASSFFFLHSIAELEKKKWTVIVIKGFLNIVDWSMLIWDNHKWSYCLNEK
jgi:hypothetical protein